MATKVTADNLADVIRETLEQYNESVNRIVPQALDKVADDTRAAIRSSAPANKGTYAKGWQRKAEKGSAGNYKVIVYNGSKHKTLSHLLEFGHATRNGGVVKGQAHIQPAEETAEKTIVDYLRTQLEGAKA